MNNLTLDFFNKSSKKRLVILMPHKASNLNNYFDKKLKELSIEEPEDYEPDDLDNSEDKPEEFISKILLKYWIKYNVLDWGVIAK